MTQTAQQRLGTITVELSDAEGQFLSSVVLGAMQRAALTPEQKGTATLIALRMLHTINAKNEALVREYGKEGAEQLAREAEAEAGDIGEVHWHERWPLEQQAAEEARADFLKRAAEGLAAERGAYGSEID